MIDLKGCIIQNPSEEISLETFPRRNRFLPKESNSASRSKKEEYGYQNVDKSSSESCKAGGGDPEFIPHSKEYRTTHPRVQHRSQGDGKETLMMLEKGGKDRGERQEEHRSKKDLNERQHFDLQFWRESCGEEGNDVFCTENTGSAEDSKQNSNAPEEAGEEFNRFFSPYIRGRCPKGRGGIWLRGCVFIFLFIKVGRKLSHSGYEESRDGGSYEQEKEKIGNSEAGEDEVGHFSGSEYLDEESVPPEGEKLGAYGREAEEDAAAEE